MDNDDGGNDNSDNISVSNSDNIRDEVINVRHG